MQCNALQAQVDRLSSERRRRGGGGGGFFKWSAFWFGGGMGADVARVDNSESDMESRKPPKGKKSSTATAESRKTASSGKLNRVSTVVPAPVPTCQAHPTRPTTAMAR